MFVVIVEARRSHEVLYTKIDVREFKLSFINKINMWRERERAM